MSWGTYYKYDGYLSRINMDELHEKRQEAVDYIESIWREILAYMASTPPKTYEDEEGGSMSYQEHIAFMVKRYQDEISENEQLIARIDDALETLQEHPENITDDAHYLAAEIEEKKRLDKTFGDEETEGTTEEGGD